MATQCPDPNLFVIFGGTGDLTRRKLLPALCRLAADGGLGERCHVLAVTPETKHDDASYRTLARESLAAAEADAATAEKLCARLHFQTLGDGSADAFRALGARLEELDQEHQLGDNRAYYLAIPPRFFGSTIAGLGRAGLARKDGSDRGGWTRLVIEKPYGRDLASARSLSLELHEHFDEAQVYRIDHYLGKDTVQNLMVLRFANTLFESMWNRDRVHSVQIDVAESVGVGTRAGYYDHAGALRDMVQNHMTQLLTLVAMEVPSAFEASAIRYEKIKVLRSITPIRPQDVVRGQYRAGRIDGGPVPGYLEADGVEPGSDTETFVALRLFVDSWRWQGVPFLLRTGKRMPRRLTQIAIRFRDVPVSLFKSLDGVLDTTDVLLITLQPNEGFSLHFDIKKPGSPLSLQRIPLSFRYDELFDSMPSAYETLVADVLLGDQTLFVHADEVEESWRIYTPLLDHPPAVCPYDAGSWGPAEADILSIPERALWQTPDER